MKYRRAEAESAEGSCTCPGSSQALWGNISEYLVVSSENTSSDILVALVSSVMWGTRRYRIQCDLSDVPHNPVGGLAGGTGLV
ncbi:hypothetical protein Nmel_011837 [Mimus melanotis]